MKQELEVRETVRARYAEAARAATSGEACGCAESGASACCSTGCCDGPEGIFGAGLYDPAEVGALPEAALLASLGCGNPVAVAELRPGENVLDLGSGGGIDVLLSAR